MKQITYTPAAQKFLQRMPRNEALKVRSKIVQYAADPKSQANNLKRLQGTTNYRLRVGDWRVVFSDTKQIVKNEPVEIIAVLKVGPRGGIYD